MKIQVWIQVRHVEPLEGFGVVGRKMAVADVLADNRAVLSLHQGVVGRAVRT